MTINASTGAITLPSGFELNRSSEIEALRASGLCAPHDIYNPGTPWYYHRFSDGDFEGHKLGFSVCFYQSQRSPKSVLTTCSFGASPWNKENAPPEWSLDVDAQQLELNLHVLKNLLGQPHQMKKNCQDWKDFPVLRNCAVYNFSWGGVWCGSEDPKTSQVNSSIFLAYADNQKWAHDDYKRSAPVRLMKSWWERWKR